MVLLMFRSSCRSSCRMDLHSSNSRDVSTEVHDLRSSVILHEGPTDQDPSPTDQDADLSLPLASDTSMSSVSPRLASSKRAHGSLHIHSSTGYEMYAREKRP